MIEIDDEINVIREEAVMKWHKFFAWAGMICMALSLYTGYKHK